MRLKDAEIGMNYSIKGFNNSDLYNRVCELGFYPGNKVLKLTYGIVMVGNSRYAVGNEFLESLELNEI